MMRSLTFFYWCQHGWSLHLGVRVWKKKSTITNSQHTKRTNNKTFFDWKQSDDSSWPGSMLMARRPTRDCWWTFLSFPLFFSFPSARHKYGCGCACPACLEAGTALDSPLQQGRSTLQVKRQQRWRYSQRQVESGAPHTHTTRQMDLGRQMGSIFNQHDDTTSIHPPSQSVPPSLKPIKCHNGILFPLP